MRVTQMLEVSKEMSVKFWRIYDEAYSKLRTASPCRQYLLEDEFFEEMEDPRIIKFILWDGDGDSHDHAVGMALVAQDLTAIPWISPHYFAGNFPEQYHAKKIYYFGALLVDGALRVGHATRLLAELENFVFANDGIACFDCSDVNNAFLPELIKQTGERQGIVDCKYLGAQHYYAYVSQGFLPGYSEGKPYGD